MLSFDRGTTLLGCQSLMMHIIPAAMIIDSQENFIKLLGPVRDVLSRQMRIRVLKSVPLLAKLSDIELDRVS